MQRCRADEKLLRPSVGLLQEDKSVKRHYLDSQDEWSEVQEEHFDSSNLVEELESLDTAQIDFESAVKQAAYNKSEGVKKEILEAMQ